MESALAERIAKIVSEGGGEGDPRFLPLVTLDSGIRYGIDASLRWIAAPADRGASTAIGPTNVHLLHEALEWKRDRFEESVGEAARALGLPEDDVVVSFPVAALVRAILAKRSGYLSRLALSWLRPSELRELREDIVRVTVDKLMPGPVRELAERLVVPLTVD